MVEREVVNICFQAEDGVRDGVASRRLGGVNKRQLVLGLRMLSFSEPITKRLKGGTVSRAWDLYLTPWKTFPNPSQRNVTLKDVMKGWF